MGLSWGDELSWSELREGKSYFLYYIFLELLKFYHMPIVHTFRKIQTYVCIF